jgi:hypothetical protein
VSGLLSLVSLESGWVVTEVGRQPWTVVGLLLTRDAVATSGNLWLFSAGTLVIYAAIGVGTVLVAVVLFIGVVLYAVFGLRGAGFAFRKVSVRTAEQRVTGAAFAASSVITPFFFGTVAGAIASGRVPPTAAATRCGAGSTRHRVLAASWRSWSAPTGRRCS